MPNDWTVTPASEPTDDEIRRRYDLFANNVAALARADALRLCAVTAVPDPAYVSCYGDLFSWEEFVGSVTCRALIDYDGYGVWSDGMFVSDRPFTPGERAFYFDDMHATHYPPVIRPVVLPSRLVNGTLVRPAWATHVLWFNT